MSAPSDRVTPDDIEDRPEYLHGCPHGHTKEPQQWDASTVVDTSDDDERVAVRHELKTWPEPYSAMLGGHKVHEIRVNDRAFAVGDVLVLREWQPQRDRIVPEVGYDGYTGNVIVRVVTYISAGGAWGLPENLCVMSVQRESAEAANGGRP